MKHYDLLESLLGRPLFPPSEDGTEPSLAWSIRNHLKVLLNTRKGTINFKPEYGLSDVSVVFKEFPDSIEMLRQQIERAIRDYEPRLTNVNASLVDREDKLFRATYLVSAEIRSGPEKESIRFRTRINSDGLMEIL